MRVQLLIYFMKLKLKIKYKGISNFVKKNFFSKLIKWITTINIIIIIINLDLIHFWSNTCMTIISVLKFDILCIQKNEIKTINNFISRKRVS